MPDPMFPHVPSLDSMLTLGMRDPNSAPTVQTNDEQFLDAMLRRGAKVIQNEDQEKEQS